MESAPHKELQDFMLSVAKLRQHLAADESEPISCKTHSTSCVGTINRTK